MLVTRFLVVLGQLHLVGAFHVIHGSNMHAVGTHDLHVFLDGVGCDHCCSSIALVDNVRAGIVVPAFDGLHSTGLRSTHNNRNWGGLIMRELIFVFAMALAPLAATPASAQDDPSVHMVTYIEGVPAAQGQVTALLRQLANASRKDAGLIRFEIL